MADWHLELAIELYLSQKEESEPHHGGDEFLQEISPINSQINREFLREPIAITSRSASTSPTPNRSHDVSGQDDNDDEISLVLQERKRKLPDLIDLEGGTSSTSPAARFFGAPRHSTYPTSNRRNLVDLFKSPDDILFQGSLEDAKIRARALHLWILLDLQDATQFVCQCLNRDLWSDPSVKEYIRENFIFLQYELRSPNGRNYLNFYPVQQIKSSIAASTEYKMPHIALIDPRTGERTKVWTRATPFTPDEFFQEMSDFLERNPLISNNARKNDILVNPNPTKTVPIPILSNTENPTVTYVSSTAQSKDTVKNDVLQAVDIAEPSQNCSSDSVTRIQFRFPDGTRYARRYFKSTLIKQLYESLLFKFKVFSRLELVFQGTPLENMLEVTLEEAKLLNASIIVKNAS